MLKKHLILTDSNDELRTKSIDLDFNHITDNEQYLIDQMMEYIDICYRKENEKYGITAGVAIAGNQVGLFKKVIYLHFDDDGKEIKYLLANPKITAHSYQKAYLASGEGCLSVPNAHSGIVPRYARIYVEAYDLINHQPITIDATGFLAICLQHEIDHLSGVLYYDHINPKNPNYTQPD